VPEDAANVVCPEGRNWSQTLLPSNPALVLAVPWIWVPGAMVSGLTRSPSAGPRLEKPITSMALSAPVGPTLQPSVQSPSSSLGRSFSEAPTLSTFLPVAGLPTVELPEPELPAAKICINC